MMRSLLEAAEGEVAPSISALVIERGQECFAHHADRVYDLASLTKVLCTTELALRHLDLENGHPLLPPGVTIAHVLQHTSGWPAWKAFFPARREEVIAAVLREPLVAAPGSVHCYSDLGFIALGAVLEAESGARLDALWTGPLRWGDARAEPTGAPGVHDENARAMEGVAPHAGLFGSAREVAAVVARWLDGNIPRAREAFTRRGVGTHALGWDTPNPDGTSSAGPRPPPGAVGHLGFTGTSLWMDPVRGRIAVLLSNRVALPGDASKVKALRAAWHSEAWSAIDSTSP